MNTKQTNFELSSAMLGSAGAAQILRFARKLLSKEVKWARKHFAYDIKGNVCQSRSRKACKWCLAGALFRHFPMRVSKLPDEVIEAIKPHILPHDVIARFNDDPNTTHRDILRVLDAAISGLNVPALSQPENQNQPSTT